MLTEVDIKDIIKRGDKKISDLMDSKNTIDTTLILDSNLNTNVINNGIAINENGFDISGYLIIPFRAIVRQRF